MRAGTFWFDMPAEFLPKRSISGFTLEPGETCVVFAADGPGAIVHVWATATDVDLRSVILEMFWDDQETPSVACPLAEFFGIGHGLNSMPFSSPLLYNAPNRGYNCYFPMPFGKRALIRMRNDGDAPSPVMRFDCDFRLFEEEATPMRFHAQWRRVCPALRRAEPLSIVEAQGRGFLAGVVYHVRKTDAEDRWTHGGADVVFLDGDSRPNLIYTAGGENFSGGAWGLYPASGPTSGAHHVQPVPQMKDDMPVWQQHEDGRYSFYRWFIHDPIPFSTSIRFAFNTMANEISCTGYWYQTLPSRPLMPLPSPEARAFKSPCPGESAPEPMSTADDLSVALLGYFRTDRAGEWQPSAPIDLSEGPPTNMDQPYGCHISAPTTARWQRTATHFNFLDLQAVYRPKAAIGLRGKRNCRTLPIPGSAFVLVRTTTEGQRTLNLEVGFQDQLDVYVNGSKVASLCRAFPAVWGTETVALDLTERVNDIVLRTTLDRDINWSVWVLSIRFLEMTGSPAEGIVFDDFGTLESAPERWREPDFPPPKT